jgi:hypothetical protein
MNDHPSSDELEQFVRGGVSSASFDCHVSWCAACASQLATEAKIELLGRRLAGQRRLRLVAPGWSRGRGYLMGAMLAVAASLLLFFHAVHAIAATGGVRSPPAAGAAIVDAGSPEQLASIDGG